MISRRALLPVILLVLAASRGICGDFTMGRYDPSQTSFCPDALPMPIVLDWELTLNRFTGNAASPVMVGKTGYFACSDHVYAVDMETGLIKWKYPSEQGLGGMVKVTPAYYNGMLYFGDTLGNLYCVSTDTGTFQWAYQTRSAIRCPPVIDEGVIYVGSDDKSVYAIDAASGESAAGWTKPFVARDDFAVGLAVSNGIVVASCMDGNLYGIHEGSGKLKWGPVRLSEAPVDTSPVVEQNVVVMAVGTTMYGLNIRGGQLKWTLTIPSEVAATPAVCGSDIYVPCKDKKLYAYTVTSRQPVMKWTEGADIGVAPTSTPVIAGDLIFVTGSKGMVHAFSTADGARRWRYVVSPSLTNAAGADYVSVTCSPTIGDGRLLLLTDDGVLHCFSPEAPDAEAPDVFRIVPVSGLAMSGAPPIKMSAILYDIGCGVDFSTASMLLDGQPVDSKIDYVTSTISYQTEEGDPDKPVRPAQGWSPQHHRDRQGLCGKLAQQAMVLYRGRQPASA